MNEPDSEYYVPVSRLWSQSVRSNGLLMEVTGVYLVTAVFLCVLTLNLRGPKGGLAKGHYKTAEGCS
jgi:hypothetical protein